MKTLDKHSLNLLKSLCKSQHIVDSLNFSVNALPDDQKFDDDRWHIKQWDRRSRNIILDFAKYSNHDLRIAVKLCICHRRQTRNIAALTAKVIFNEVIALDSIIGDKSLLCVTTSDFHRTERAIISKHSRSYAERSVSYLEDFSNWLLKNFDIHAVFKSNLVRNFAHGRNASDVQRAEKLLPTECIDSIMRMANNDELKLQDRFYFNTLVLCIAGGFRLGELATLPADCLVSLSNGHYGIRYFPEKYHQAPIKPIPPALNDSAKNSLKKLTEWTADGRRIAKKCSNSKRLDWRRISAHPDLLIYFLEKWCNKWSSDPNNSFINPHAGWSTALNRWVDAESILKEHVTIRAACRSLGISDTAFKYIYEQQIASKSGRVSTWTYRKNKNCKNGADARLITISKFQKHIQILFNSKQRARISPTIEKAQAAQLKGKIYPAPTTIELYERSSLLIDKPIVTDSGINGGKVLLKASNALLVYPLYWFSNSYCTSTTEYSLFGDNRFIQWLNGRKRSGVKSKNIDENSVFERHNIVDPRTNDYLHLTVHDIRHWLNTVMEEGGAAQETIRVMFARKGIEQNQIYDQTNSTTRVNRIKNDVRSNLTTGLVQINYNKLLQTRGDKEAEAYLDVKSGSMTNMTHGGCTLNSHSSACTHNLGCFNQVGGPCENLFVDTNDTKTKIELNRLLRESRILKANLHDESPQKMHASNVVNNISKILETEV